MINKKNIFPIIIISVILIFLIIIIIMALQSQIKTLNAQYEDLSNELKIRQDAVDELNYEFTLNEKDYIEKYAREKLGFHKTGETVFKDSN